MSKFFSSEKNTVKLVHNLLLLRLIIVKRALCITRFSAQFIEIAHMDEGTFNCSSFRAWLNVFHMLWEGKKGKGVQNSFWINKLRKRISSFFLLILLKNQASAAIIHYHIALK